MIKKFLCTLSAVCIGLTSVIATGAANVPINNKGFVGTYITAEAEDAYDFIVNTGTKKFHVAGCSRAPKPSSKNYSVIHSTASQLISEGYSPCAFCNPGGFAPSGDSGSSGSSGGSSSSGSSGSTGGSTSAGSSSSSGTSSSNVKINLAKSDPNKDGVVDSSDATAILIDYAKQILNGSGTLTTAEADSNEDGTVDSADATNILIYYANVLLG